MGVPARTTPAVSSRTHSLNGVPEWAYGVAPWFEAGLYLPLYSFGPLRAFYVPSQQQHQLFGVIDYSGKPWSIEGGLGLGLTHATDKVVLKLILSRDLN